MPTVTAMNATCSSCMVYTDIYNGVILNSKFVCCYCYERNLHIAAYCEHCGVIPIQQGDKYCEGCVNDIVDSLAVEYQESIAVEKGWM